MKSISFIVACNNKQLFEDTFKASPIFLNHHNEIILRKGFTNAGKAFNSGINFAGNDIIVIAHQDIYFPEGWDIRLLEMIQTIQKYDINWGVLGCFGISKTNRFAGHTHCNIYKELGKKAEVVPAQTLDEIVLVVNKKRNLRFDEQLPGFHLYGTDICLEAEKQGLNNYIISNFCVHNNIEKIQKLPPDFWLCANYIRKKWYDVLPIKSTCITLEKQFYKILFQRLKNYKHFLNGLKKTDAKTERLTLSEMNDICNNILQQYETHNIR